MDDYNRYVGSGSSMSSVSTAADQDRVPETQLPFQMSIEDYVSRPNRESMKMLTLRRNLAGTTWFGFSANGLSKSILRCIHDLLTKPYTTLASMPSQDREMWLRQFAQEFNWLHAQTGAFRAAFEKQAAKQFSRHMNIWKEHWVKTGKRYIKCLEMIFLDLVKYWQEETTIADSKKHSTNRNCTRGGKGPSTHKNGAMSTMTLEERITAQNNGVHPGPVEILPAMHTNKKAGEIQDPVARELIEASERLFAEERVTQGTLEGELNDVVLEWLWKEIARITGLLFEKDEEIKRLTRLLAMR